jgi:hypothetical protein
MKSDVEIDQKSVYLIQRERQRRIVTKKYVEESARQTERERCEFDEPVKLNVRRKDRQADFCEIV